jgi:hypothetical protein
MDNPTAGKTGLSLEKNGLDENGLESVAGCCC